jgi:hypothetical protein
MDEVGGEGVLFGTDQAKAALSIGFFICFWFEVSP